jgi:hypothetical protein
MAGFAKSEEKEEIKFVPLHSEPYPFFKDKYVVIGTGHNYHYGVYRGLSENCDLVLQPAVTMGCRDGITASVWEKGLPSLICHKSKVSIQPTTRKAIDVHITESHEANLKNQKPREIESK